MYLVLLENTQQNLKFVIQYLPSCKIKLLKIF